MAAGTGPLEHPAQQDYEQRLIQRIRDGEHDAFYELIRPYERRVYAAALALLRNDADAEDCAQEAVLKAFKNIRQFRAEAKFSTWLIQIAINEARMRRRRDRKPLYDSLDAGQETEEGDYMPMDLADWREIPSEAVERRQLRDALARALALLKPQYREVFMLRDVQKRNIAETAELLGVTAATVKMRLLRARLQMRDALAPCFDGSWSAGETKSRRVRNATFY